MDLQLFYRDTEQVDNWMSKQEVCTYSCFMLYKTALFDFSYISSL